MALHNKRGPGVLIMEIYFRFDDRTYLIWQIQVNNAWRHPKPFGKKHLETGFRGLRKKKSAAFLDEVSEVVDALHKRIWNHQNKLSIRKLKQATEDVEIHFFRTLKTAEEPGAAIIEEMQMTAADLIKFSESKWERLSMLLSMQ